MLWTIAVILFILWLLGFSFHVAGGLIHIILVIAVIVVVIRLVTGRAPYTESQTERASVRDSPPFGLACSCGVLPGAKRIRASSRPATEEGNARNLVSKTGT